MFSISYRLLKATFDFSRSCSMLNCRPIDEENANTVRWHSGKLGKIVNFLPVTFLTTNPNATLLILGSGFNITNPWRINTTAVTKNVENIVEVYPKKLGTEACALNLECPTKKKEKGVQWYAVLGYVVLLGVVLFVVYAEHMSTV